MTVSKFTYQTGDGTLAGTDDGELALVPDIVNEHPAEHTKAGCSVRVESGPHGTNGSVEGRASIEAEPTEPVFIVSIYACLLDGE